MALWELVGAGLLTADDSVVLTCVGQLTAASYPFMVY